MAIEEVYSDDIYMDITTHCTKCNETLSVNSTDLYNTSYIYPLSEDEIVAALNPALNALPKYAYVIWYIIGIPANFIAFTVWIQRQMINSSGCYMAALAITDNLFLAFHFIVNIFIWFPSIFLLNYPVACQVLPMVYVAIQFMSGLLVLEFTVEQYIAICHPFKRSRYCRVSIAKKVILAGTILVILLGAPQAYFFTLNTEASICHVRQSVLEGGATSAWTIWTWTTEMIMFGAIPLSCLILNIRVIYEVTRQGDVQLVRHYSRSSSSSMKQTRKQSTTTVMLLAVSLYWVCTEIPATVVLGLNEMYPLPYVMSIGEATDNADVQKYMTYKTVRTIVEVISFSRYSCKLFIYLATGRMFRKQLRLSTFKRPLQRNSSDTTMTSLATKTSSYKRGQEKAKLINAANGRLPRSISMYSRSSASQFNSLPPTNRESWGTQPPTEMSALQYEPCETCMILNNNNYKFN